MIRQLGAKIMIDNKMKAVHDKDLENLLKSLNVYDDVVNHKCTCLFCRNIITLDNIDSIVPYEQTVQFTCDNTDCHTKLLGWRK